MLHVAGVDKTDIVAATMGVGMGEQAVHAGGSNVSFDVTLSTMLVRHLCTYMHPGRQIHRVPNVSFFERSYQ